MKNVKRSGEEAAVRKKRWKRWRITALDFMALPAVIYLIINNYIPMGGMFIAFKNIDYGKGIFGSDWCGFKNFEFLFRSSDAFIIVRNTILYNLAFILLGCFMGILVGLLLNEITSKLMKKTYQTVILLPQLISIIIVAYIVYALFSNEAGFINNRILEPLGLDKVNFYNTPAYWPFILVFVQIWKTIGYDSIIYFSSIISVDRSLYEAATIDGASRFQQIRYVTLPLIKPIAITLVLMKVGRIFYSDFGLFYQVPMNSGALYNVTNTIDTYVYRALMNFNDVGMSSAAGVFQSIVGFVVILVVNGTVRKIDRENALF
ncbi:MAG: sugar ABC transporter permease [Clostridiales bacterium]|nr:sugar ABC transporter permease [Clostridiales bacterium]